MITIGWEEVDSRARRRRFFRRPLRLQARLRVGEQQFDAEMENISPGGAFLSVALPAGAEVVICSIGLPHARALQVRARVAWRRAEPAGVGLAFEAFLDRADTSADTS